MNEPQLRPVTDAAEWSALCAGFADMNYRQTWAYAHASAAAAGAACECVACERGGAVLGLAAVRLRRVPMIGGGLAHLSGGPLTRTNDGDRDAAAVCDALERTYVVQQGLTLRVMAPLGSESENAACEALYRQRGYTAAAWPRPYRTIAIDTTRTPEEIRASFSKNWRKKLRRGETRGLTVRLAEDADAMDEVVRLHHELIERKGFNTDVSAELLRTTQEGLSGDERMTAVLVELDGRTAGMNLVSAMGDTLTGIIGATTDEGAKKGGAYLLEWAAIGLACERGLLRYDMGGFDPAGNPGVADFKGGTRGTVLTAAGPLEKRAVGLRPGLARLGERIYRAVRRAPAARTPLRKAG